MSEKTFWTTTRRRLIAKTLANLFLLLIGASATSEVVQGVPPWLKWLLGGLIAAAGVAAVCIEPPEEKKGQEER